MNESNENRMPEGLADALGRVMGKTGDEVEKDFSEFCKKQESDPKTVVGMTLLSKDFNQQRLIEFATPCAASSLKKSGALGLDGNGRMEIYLCGGSTVEEGGKYYAEFFPTSVALDAAKAAAKALLSGTPMGEREITRKLHEEAMCSSLPGIENGFKVICADKAIKDIYGNTALADGKYVFDRYADGPGKYSLMLAKTADGVTGLKPAPASLEDMSPDEQKDIIRSMMAEAKEKCGTEELADLVSAAIGVMETLEDITGKGEFQKVFNTEGTKTGRTPKQITKDEEQKPEEKPCDTCGGGKVLSEDEAKERLSSGVESRPKSKFQADLSDPDNPILDGVALSGFTIANDMARAKVGRYLTETYKDFKGLELTKVSIGGAEVCRGEEDKLFISPDLSAAKALQACEDLLGNPGVLKWTPQGIYTSKDPSKLVPHDICKWVESEAPVETSSLADPVTGGSANTLQALRNLKGEIQVNVGVSNVVAQVKRRIRRREFREEAMREAILDLRRHYPKHSPFVVWGDYYMGEDLKLRKA